MKRSNIPSARGGEPWTQARVTDRLRNLESIINEWNLQQIELALKTKTGRKRLLAAMKQSPCYVA
jgi:hypothetical protein